MLLLWLLWLLWLLLLLGSFWRWRQRKRQKSNRFSLTKQQLCTCITLFCTHFLCRHCTTSTWNFLISHFVEDVNTRQRVSFSFPELWYSILEFNSRKNCQHLTNRTRWNKRDKVWSSANSLFKWRFRSRRRRCCSLQMLGLACEGVRYWKKKNQWKS